MRASGLSEVGKLRAGGEQGVGGRGFGGWWEAVTWWTDRRWAVAGGGRAVGE